MHDPDFIAGRDPPDITGALGPGFEPEQQPVDIGTAHDTRGDVGNASLGDPQLGVLIVTGAGQQLTHRLEGQAIRGVQIDLHSAFLEYSSETKCRTALLSCLSRRVKSPAKWLTRYSDFPDFTSAIMTTVSIDADIKAKWQDGHSSYSPGSTEELAIIGIDLLVRDLGTEAAQSFIEQIFEKHLSDQKTEAVSTRE
ncbi:hypothetical protein D3C81_1134020 [compost metagenome]